MTHANDGTGDIAYLLNTSFSHGLSLATGEIHFLTGTPPSAQWIQTEYNNQSVPGTFVTEGAPQIQGGPVSVTVTSVPAGLTLTVDGSVCTAPCGEQWIPGSNHTIAAATQAGATGTQYVFGSWSDSGAATHTVTGPAAPASYTATFQTQYSLTTAANPTAGGTISPASGWYNAGAVVGVSAAAGSGYQFTGFSGGLSGTTTPQNVTMNGPVSVTANFSVAAVSVTVTSVPAGLTLTVDGVGCTAPCGEQWIPGSNHTIAAATQAGATGTQYVFGSWSDSGAATHTVTGPAAPASYTATFQTQYCLMTAANPTAEGTISPASGWYNAGAVVAVSAAAGNGYQFTGFSGGLSGTTTPQNVTMNGPVSVTANFGVASGPWYSVGGAWNYRKALTINHGQVAGSLTNFPVLISVTDSDLAAGAQASGNDILFTAADGVTKLNHEIEQYVSGTGQLIAWVQVPSVSSASDTVIYMYYGNASAAGQANAAGVWDANYQGVWHLGNGTALSVADSTGNGNNGINVGATAALGGVEGAAAYNGSASVHSGSNIGITGNAGATLEAWVKLGSTSGEQNLVCLGYPNSLQQMVLDTNVNGAGSVSVEFAYNGMRTAAGVIGAGQWHHLVATKTPGAINATTSLYVDGVAQNFVVTSTNTPNLANQAVYVGKRIDGVYGLNGLMDEVRVSNTARSGQWIQTEYNSQSAPGTFVTVGSQQTYAGGVVSVTVTSVPAGLTLTVDGVGCTAPCGEQWIPGSSHTIAAAAQAGPTGTQYVFGSWSDSGAATHTVTGPAAPASYTATFQTQYSLTTGANPTAGGTISPASGWYNAGAVVGVSAAAGSGYQFTGFSGGLSGTTTPQNVTMNGPVSVTANFSVAPVSVTVTSVPAGLTLTVDGSVCTAPCGEQWIPGSNHTIAAAAQAGATGTQYVFGSWSDSGAATHTVAGPAAPASYTATFQTQYYLTTGANPTAEGTISPASGWYNAGAVVAVSATAGSGYQFAGFSGGLSGTTTPQNVTMNGPVSVTANFSLTPVSVTVTSAPAGLTLTVDGAGCTAPCGEQWIPGSNHTIAAATQAGATGTQYVFASWSDSGAATHTVTGPAAPASYTATFQTQYSLTTGANPSAGGTISPASGWYNAGAVVGVSAAAGSGYQFTGFSGGLSGTTTPQNVTMNGPVSVTANFSVAPVSVTVTSVPVGLTLTVDGSVCTAPCGEQWIPGSNHTIAAAAQAGATGTQYVFASWSDSGAATHMVTGPAAPASYTAMFQTQYSLTTGANPSAGGTISPASGWYNAGAVIGVSAAAGSGYQFTGFSGGLSGTTTPQNVTMNGPVSVTANFSVASGSWYSVGGAWNYRKALTINHGQVAGSLANFPVLVSVTDSNLAAGAQASGNDILFTAADGVTKLNHEMEQYVSGTGQLIAWVQAPSVSPASDTVIYMYYGNASAAGQANAAGVWDANYQGVWHLGNGTVLSVADSTGNGNNGINVGATAALGGVEGAAAYNGSASVHSGSNIGITGNAGATLEAWVKLGSTSGEQNLVCLGYPNSLQQMVLDTNVNGAGSVSVEFAYNGMRTAAGVIGAGQWHHLVATKTPGAINATTSLYVDGVAQNFVVTSTNTPNLANQAVYVGKRIDGVYGLNGLMDEVRVSNTARSGQWIQTEYNSQSAPGTFVTVGSQQTPSSGGSTR